MRVLHVAAYYAPAFAYGGPPRSIHGLCQALVAAGCELRVLTTDANGPRRLSAEQAAVTVFEGVPVGYYPLSPPAWPLGSAALVRALDAELARASVLHVHGLWNRVVWAAVRRARRAGVPYVVSPRGMLDEGSLAHHAWRKRLAYLFTDRATVRGAAILHATSDTEARGIRAWCPEGRVEVVPNGVAPASPDLGVTRASLGLPGQGPLIVTVARLHPIKRLDILVDAFVQILARRPNARLVVAGPDEARLWPALQARAGRHRDALHWLGAVDAGTRDALLGMAGVYVSCSDSESFGLSLVEAMRSGAPVVATDTCGWPEIGTAGAGQVVAQTPEAVAAGVLTVLERPDEGRSLGEQGRRLVGERFDWNAVAARMVQLYQDIARPVPRAS